MRDWVAVILPGRGYTALGAALRLPTLVLEAAGAASVVVEYSSLAGAAEPHATAGASGAEEVRDAFHRGVRDQVASAIESARRVTFVAKSLGTLALAHLGVDLVRGIDADAIWITPLFTSPDVRRGALALALRSLLVAGTADSAHHAGFHEEVRTALGAQSLLLHGADHSLEVPGNPLQTVERLRELTETVTSFIS